MIDGTTLMSSMTDSCRPAGKTRRTYPGEFPDGNSGAALFGTWIDASFAQGRIVQNAGVFRIDPDMTWGNQLITNDAQGG